VLHDADLAEAIVDRILERGRLVLLNGPSYRTQHLDLNVDGAELAHDEPGQSFRNPQRWPSAVTPGTATWCDDVPVRTGPRR